MSEVSSALPMDQSRVVPSSEEERTFFPTPRIVRLVIALVCPMRVRGFDPSCVHDISVERGGKEGD